MIPRTITNSVGTLGVMIRQGAFGCFVQMMGFNKILRRAARKHNRTVPFCLET